MTLNLPAVIGREFLIGKIRIISKANCKMGIGLPLQALKVSDCEMPPVYTNYKFLGPMPILHFALEIILTLCVPRSHYRAMFLSVKYR